MPSAEEVAAAVAEGRALVQAVERAHEERMSRLDGEVKSFGEQHASFLSREPCISLSDARSAEDAKESTIEACKKAETELREVRRRAPY